MRQAKILSKGQTEAVLAYLTSTRYPERNRAIFLLSVKAGLRAKEIASLTWAMLTDAEGKIGDAIHLVDEASKGSSGRVIPLNKELKAALVQSQVGGRPSPFVVTTERAARTSAAAIVNRAPASCQPAYARFLCRELPVALHVRRKKTEGLAVGADAGAT